MTSTLGYALLGLLSREPLTGYALASRMRAPIGYFWNAGHSQIYPELKQLQGAGMVVSEVVDGPGPRPTRRYHLSERGREALRAWVASPITVEPARSEFLLRVYCLWLVDPRTGRQLVEEYRAGHLDRLVDYQRQEAHLLPEPARGSPGFASYATLRAGISYERHVVDYCDWLLAALTPTKRGLPTDR